MLVVDMKGHELHLVLEPMLRELVLALVLLVVAQQLALVLPVFVGGQQELPGLQLDLICCLF
jgi:hypothetical protein